MTASPDPAVESILERQRAAPVPPLDALSVQGMRRLFAAWNEPDGEPDVGTATDLSIDGPGCPLPIRAYVPAGDGPHPVLVYYHGGGWVLGDLDTHDGICRAVTDAADCLTLAIDYRRAPEHPFPAAVEDAYAALQWAVDHGATLGGDTDRVAVAGDSAGATLAAVASLLARENEGLDVAAQVLAYPVTNYDEELDSYTERAEYGISDDPNWFKDLYLESTIDGYNPLAFPCQAGDLRDLPPALVVTCEFDALRDDGVTYAERLADDGVPTDHRHFDGMVHGFLHYDHLDARAEAVAAVGDFLANAFDS